MSGNKEPSFRSVTTPNEPPSTKLIQELKVLRLQAGQTLVIQCDRKLTDDDMRHLLDVAEQAGIKALFLDGGLKAVAVQQ